MTTNTVTSESELNELEATLNESARLDDIAARKARLARKTKRDEKERSGFFFIDRYWPGLMGEWTPGFREDGNY